jgi:undecaprenyl-diphosphatase
MDKQIFFFFYDLAHKADFLDNTVVFFAVIFPYIVILLAGTFLLLHHEDINAKNIFSKLLKKWREIALVFFSGILSWFFADILKIIFHTARPFVKYQKVTSLFFENGFAFPSGHATFFMALAFAIFLSHKKVGYVFILFALLIGVARIIAGVHSPTDILGGFILGALTAYLVRFLYNRYIRS